MPQYYPLTEEQLRNIPGSDRVFEWYGRWPTLHDSYLLDMHLSVWERSYFRLHVYRSFDETENSEAILTVFVDKIKTNEVSGIGDQLLGVTFFRSDDAAFRIVIEGAIQANALIEAQEMSFDLRTWPFELSAT